MRSANNVYDINFKNPSYKLVTITIEEVFHALEKNGMKLTRGQFYSKTGISACILGQGAANLNTLVSNNDGDFAPPKIENVIWDLEQSENYDTLYYDKYHYNLVNQLNRFVLSSNSKWNKTIYPAGLANIIMYWNDKKENGRYVLRTYEDVVAMAREVLEPFFKQTVTLVELS